MTPLDPKSVRIRFSHLKKFARSAKHYRHALESNDEATWLRKGSATHALVYGTPRVAVFDGVRNGGKWEAFKAENVGAILVNVKEYEAAKAMADAVRSDPVVRELGLLTSPGAVVEQEIEWEVNGRLAKSTPDLFTPRFVMDLKSTRLAEVAFFLREIVRMNYHAQLEFYRQAIQHKHGFTPRDSYIVAVESKAPHEVLVFKLTPRLLAMGGRSIVLWLEELHACESANHWPGKSLHVIEADVPEWMLDENEDDEETDEEAA